MLSNGNEVRSTVHAVGAVDLCASGRGAAGVFPSCVLLFGLRRLLYLP